MVAEIFPRKPQLKKTLDLLNHIKSVVLSTLSPDVILLQEAPELVNIMMYLSDKYDVAHHGAHPHGNYTFDSLATLIRKGSPWKVDCVSIVPTVLCLTKRITTVTSIKNDNKTIAIANVHLCGGRFDEKDVVTRKIPVDDKLNTMKTETLSKIISGKSSAKPDIIIGDFNSDMYGAIDPATAKNRIYLTNLGFNDNMIQAWNSAPFTFIKENHYILAPYVKTGDSPLQIMKTSAFGPTPDATYFSISRLEYTSSDVINLIDTGFTDHNGLFVQLNCK